MNRYFFNVHDGEHIIDDVGSELPDLAAVREEALETAIQLLKRSAAGIWAGEEWTMNVLDEAGQEVATLRFSATQRNSGS